MERVLGVGGVCFKAEVNFRVRHLEAMLGQFRAAGEPTPKGTTARKANG